MDKVTPLMMRNAIAHNLPLVRLCHSAIIAMRPTSLNYGTGVFAFLGSNCGLKGAAILHNWFAFVQFNLVGRRLWLPLFVLWQRAKK